MSAGFLHDLIFDYTLRNVALGSGILGVASGALGSFAVLRRQSLVGDAISHASLPGIALAFMLSGSKSSIVLMLGAALSGWLATLFVMKVVQATRIKSDAALGIALSVFFGTGLVLLTFIQRSPDARKAGLDTFLFGQASSLVAGDVLTMGALAGAALALVLAFWKEFKILSFDPGFGETIGVRVRFSEIALTSLLVVSIVVGLQTVGVVLMSAMVVAPAAAARQWTDRLGVMVLLAAVFGMTAGVTGALISSLTAHLPTGPMIVLCAGVIVIVSLLFAPRRGLIFNRFRRRRQRRKLQINSVLLNLHELSLQHDDPDYAHAAEVLRTMSDRPFSVGESLRALRVSGLVEKTAPDNWSLTATGHEEARRLLDAPEERR